MSRKANGAGQIEHLSKKAKPGGSGLANAKKPIDLHIYDGLPFRNYGSGRDVIESDEDKPVRLFLNGGNDLVVGIIRNAVINAGNGYDTLSFLAENRPVRINLTTHFHKVGDEAVLPRIGFDNVLGSLTKPNVLIGGPTSDRMAGGGADDLLRGMDGYDKLLGGDGDDVLAGGRHDDEISGGGGDDSLNGGEHDDQLDGGKGKDRILGGSGGDRINGGPGADWIQSGHDDDRLTGGAGHDTLIAGPDDDMLDGGEGNDLLDAGPGDDVANGGAGNDTIRALGYDNMVKGGAGDDRIDVQGGTVYGEDGNDQISIGRGAANGGAGNDHFTPAKTGGNNLSLILVGGQGDDSAFFESNTVRLGTPLEERATGVKIFGIESVAFGKNGRHHVVIDKGKYDLTLGNRYDEIYVNTSGNVARLIGGDDEAKINGDGNTLYGGRGNDRIEVTGANDIYAGPGNDDLKVYTDRATYSGGAGKDEFDIRGVKGNNLAEADATFLGGPGNDRFSIYSRFKSLDAGPGNDKIFFGGGGTGTIYSELLGGRGADTFRFIWRGGDPQYAERTIHDFSPVEDEIRIRSVKKLADFESIEQIGEDSVLQVSNPVRRDKHEAGWLRLTLENVSISDLTDDVFS